MGAKQLVQGSYVTLMHGAGRASRRVGIDDKLADSSSRMAAHLRTLPAIHDAERLASLDVPWWSYPAIAEVDEFLAARPDARVFEFGSGASTVWLARRAAEVYTIEHDVRFYPVVEDLIAPFSNITSRLIEPRPITGLEDDKVIRSGRAGHADLDFTEYVHSIRSAPGPFDLIVVDGRARSHAFREAWRHLADDGIIVFDNVDRAEYQPVLNGCPGIVERLRGWTPCLPYKTTTAIISHA